MLRLSLSLLLAINTAQSLPQCPPANFTTVTHFDLDAFISTRWYIQELAETKYLPKDQNYCVHADYELKEKPNFWGWEVAVHNHAEEVAPPHVVHDSGDRLCAGIVDRDAGKLQVAPCFLPKIFAGDYWVVDWSDAEGYALISGGPPTIPAEGGCRTGTGVNEAGLWLFTRAQQRDDNVISKLRNIAKAKGFDISVLNPVDQTSCSEASKLRNFFVI